MHSAKTNFHVVVPYTNLAKEGRLELCLSSHSICFLPMRINISTLVQLGPGTLWGSVACDCDGPDDDRARFDPPLAYPPHLVAVGAKKTSVGLSKNSDPKPEFTWAFEWMDIVSSRSNPRC